MLFSTLILVSVDGEHDGLEEGVDLGHRHQPAEMGNMPRLRLQQEHQVAVLLGLVVIGESTLLHIGSIFKITGNFILLESQSVHQRQAHFSTSLTHLLQCHAILN